MKKIIFLFAYLFVNVIYSQVPPCGVGYSLGVTGSSTTCNYTLTPVIPGHPSITSIDWAVASSGTYSKNCYTYTGSTFTQQYCFDGSYDVTYVVHFSGGTSCYYTTTISIACSGAPTCDPDPNRISAVPDPSVEITYVAPVTCGGSNSAVTGCMYANGCTPSYFCIACSWKYNFRIVPSSYNCEFFTYWCQYIQATDCNGGTACASFAMNPGQDYCIEAKVSEPIYIVADGNHCCVPDGYQRAYFWTPGPSGGAGTISDPTGPVGICGGNRCPTTSCTENSVTMSATTGFPNSGCFTGGNNTQNRTTIKLGEFANKEQNIVIYNSQGIIMFNGKWKFGNTDNLNLVWPGNIPIGIYFVKFIDLESKGICKLFKLDN